MTTQFLRQTSGLWYRHPAECGRSVSVDDARLYDLEYRHELR